MQEIDCFILYCMYWHFFLLSILLLCFMPLLRTCCMRALERDGYLATWPLLSLIMRIVCSRARVRVACLLFLFIILRNSWPVVVGAEQRKAAQRSFNNYEQQTCAKNKTKSCSVSLLRLRSSICVCFLEFSFSQITAHQFHSIDYLCVCV